MPSFIQVNLETGTFGSWFGGMRRNRETGRQEEMPPPEHPCQLGPFPGIIDPYGKRLRPDVLDRLRKGDETVKALPLEDVLEDAPLAPDTAFARKWDTKKIIEALHSGDQALRNELLRDAAPVKEYFDTAAAEEAAKKR